MTRKRIAQILCGIYLGVLYLWFALYVFTGDQIGYVGLANYVAQLYFMPLILVAGLAVARRWRGLTTAALGAGLIFIYLWGALFVPQPAPEPTNRPALKVMTLTCSVCTDWPSPRSR